VTANAAPQALRTPSLTRRVVLAVLAAFAVVFVVLFAFIAYSALNHESGEIDRVAMRAALSLAQALDDLPPHADPPAALAVLQRVLLDPDLVDNTGPPMDLAAARLDGSARQGSRLAPQLDVLSLPTGMVDEVAPGVRAYVAASRDWKVAYLDRSELRGHWALKVLFADLALYIGMALPIVLLPVWWAVRTGLQPLHQLSQAVAERDPLHTHPLPASSSYRELEPLRTAMNRHFERTAHSLVREKAFVHDAAHEMRTPLAVVASQAQLLLQSDEATRETAHSRLQAAVTRASHVTQQLLDLARADTTGTEPGASADLMNEARDAMALLADRAAAQGTELELNGPDQLRLATHPRLLRSIIDNLLDNALRHGGHGGVVRVDVAHHGHTCHLQVSDDGPGIATENRELAFERFWRASAEPGAGLGLAIVRQAARALGGDAWVADAASSADLTTTCTGARICVRLPTPTI
jgi:two-component system, OmpR family, sensor histidine kinase QseC